MPDADRPAPQPLSAEEEAEVRRDLDPDDAYQYGGWAHLVSRILATLDEERGFLAESERQLQDWIARYNALISDAERAARRDMLPSAEAIGSVLDSRYGRFTDREQGLDLNVETAKDILRLATPAPALDAERLARMLVDSGLMRRYDEYSRDAHPDTMRRVESLDSLAMDWALAMLASEPEDAPHPDAGDPARNHFDWFMPESPTAAVDDYLDSFEAKMTEALTDPFVHDMAQSVLPLIAAYRSLRTAPVPALDALPLMQRLTRASVLADALGRDLKALGCGCEIIVTRETDDGEATVAHVITANPDPAALASQPAVQEPQEASNGTHD